MSRAPNFIDMDQFIDGLVKSRKYAFSVIPAKLVLDLIGERESSDFNTLQRGWMPAAVYPALDAGRA